MKVVASTYHQCVKFPTDSGTYTIKGNQREARTCFIAEKKKKNEAASALRIANGTEDLSKKEPKDIGKKKSKENTIMQILVDRENLDRYVGIGSDLDDKIRVQLIELLRRNVSMFAWSIEDMKGIYPKIICHELNVDPSHRPVKQKRRKCGPERYRAVNDEVEHLLGAGSITGLNVLSGLPIPSS